MEGYNFRFKVGGHNFTGVTQDDMTITPTTKESITKDDAGNRRRAVSGHDITFRVAGIMDLNGTGGTDNDIDDIIEMALAKGDSAIVTFVYTRSTGQAYTGSAIITNYSESTPADGDGTYTIDFAVSGEMTASS